VPLTWIVLMLAPELKSPGAATTFELLWVMLIQYDPDSDSSSYQSFSIWVSGMSGLI
jgi:hypothetical protein